MQRPLIILIASFLLPLSCGNASTPGGSQSILAESLSAEGQKAGDGYASTYRAAVDPTQEAGFAEQWYAGVAELNVYDLEQVRYGAVHSGEAVLIFVTEDFSRSKQVKLDMPSRAGKDAVKVLKLNAMRSFETGIYAYHTMQSVFTPVNLASDPATLKVSTSSQDWCGHGFQQLNRTNSGFDVLLRSYFESEGDQEGSLADVLLEDEVLNRIRLAPETLPTGSFQALPSTLDLRLLHEATRPVSAEGRFVSGSASTGDEGSRYYELEYPSLGRTLRIQFEDAFPRAILGWEKSMRSGGQTLTTRATRKAVERSPYWQYNSPEDLPKRRALGL